MSKNRKVDPATSGGQGMSRGERKDAIRAVLFQYVHSLTRREIADAMSLGKTPYLVDILREMCNEGCLETGVGQTRYGPANYYWLSPLCVQHMESIVTRERENM